MANTLEVRDVYALMNQVVSEATGRTDLAVVDTSTFVSVGETLLRTSAETTLNAISTVLAKTIFSVRPYKSRLESVRIAQERWGGIVRKVVNLYTEAEASKDWNTNINPNNLVDGNSVDMYEILKPKVVQLNFYGSSVLTKHITRFRDQLSLAFSSEAEFMQFIDSVMVEFMNEVELLNEAKTRATIINFIAGISAMGLTEVDLVAEYNTKYGTTHTREELLSTYLESFMQFVASTIKVYSSRLQDMSVKNHANLSNYAPIMRHTPKAKQKMLMYEPIFIETQATVYSAIFNPQYLDIGTFEGVNYWQSQNDPTAIHCKPNILNVNTGESQTSELEIELPYVLGLLYDEEALGVMPQFDYASTTPFNSRGGYYNLYYHWRFNSYNDFTENAVLFVLGSGDPADSDVQE